MVHARASAAKPQMGMTYWVGTKPSKAEAVIAKNYLSPDELNALNRIVTAYLELAEVQALNRQPMYMRDWIAKLDDFLRLSGREILRHAGKISHEQAAEKAERSMNTLRARYSRRCGRSAHGCGRGRVSGCSISMRGSNSATVSTIS